ncbi:helix-turn-helix transcriptional regulator [Streptomyces naphthomycinicus]|uniref:helix-turn-helix transcriptional regulator n=1 Tax=Streptomyces naphthomycinicus TaxID=2872625 RepID=UPI001CED8B38|nr:helix-turn-helix domain-containing protein [Streptomyces sp. TML10]
MPKNPEHEGSPRLMTVTEIAAEHGVSRQTIHSYRRAGVFPSPVEGEGSTRLRFRENEVAAFFKANPKQPRKKRTFPPRQQGENVSTTVDPRIAILSALNDPPYNGVAEKRCVPWAEAVKMLDTYRAGVLHGAADDIEQMRIGAEEPNHDDRVRGYNEALDHVIAELRRKADEREASDG